MVHWGQVIPECGADDTADTMYAALDEADCLVVRDALGAESVAAVRSELAPFMSAAVAPPTTPRRSIPV